jgi:hypothetical protein
MSYFTHHPSDKAVLQAHKSILEANCKIVIYYRSSPTQKYILYVTPRAQSSSIMVRIFWTPEEVKEFCLAVASVYTIHLIDIRGTPQECKQEQDVYDSLKPIFPLITLWHARRGRKPRFH